MILNIVVVIAVAAWMLLWDVRKLVLLCLMGVTFEYSWCFSACDAWKPPIFTGYILGWMGHYACKYELQAIAGCRETIERKSGPRGGGGKKEKGEKKRPPVFRVYLGPWLQQRLETGTNALPCLLGFRIGEVREASPTRRRDIRLLLEGAAGGFLDPQARSSMRRPLFIRSFCSANRWLGTH